MYSLTTEDERLCKVDSAYRVHTRLGPGLLEKIYEASFCYELDKKGISYRRQADIPFNYDHIVFDEGLRTDVLVDNRIICELKSVEIVNPVWKAQVINHLKLSSLSIGFIINFNIPLIKNGIRRYTREKQRLPP